MANYVIVGGGASGLYTAYRLLTSGTLTPGTDTVQIYEWADRLGGRIYTYTFPDSISSDGLYVEVGGMRFATDSNFPQSTTEGHVLVQNMIITLGLTDKVVPFVESPERMYYLRGKNFYENDLTNVQQLPYNFNAEFYAFLKNVTSPYTADNILGAIATLFAPGLSTNNADRPNWCDYYAAGTVDQAAATTSFPQGTVISDIGYWNLLYDQLGDEGYDYSADGNGYTSNVINWNSADAMQANNDYGSGVNYNRLDGGYSVLFDTLAAAIEALLPVYEGSGIFYQQRLVTLSESGDQTICTFNSANGGDPSTVTADALFLAMPRRSLEIVAENSPGYALSNDQVQYYLESSLDQPAIKAVMVFADAWWVNAPEAPELTNGVGGPTITDLPLRQIYYFGNNVPGSPNNNTGPFVLLASYDDMNYSNFWRQVEVQGEYTQAPSLYRQPLTGPTNVPVDSPFATLLIKQLAEAHGMTADQVPAPMAVLFQDWGQDPFGGGYHGWSAHYNICQAMDYVRAPYQKILDQENGPKLYIIGSCYSFDQAWVEGAFCTAESVLQDFFGLPPFCGITNYQLICTASND